MILRMMTDKRTCTLKNPKIGTALSKVRKRRPRMMQDTQIDSNGSDNSSGKSYHENISTSKYM